MEHLSPVVCFTISSLISVDTIGELYIHCFDLTQCSFFDNVNFIDWGALSEKHIISIQSFLFPEVA